MILICHSNSFLFNNNFKSSYMRNKYFNARSILPKMDAVIDLTEAKNSDVICIVESWFS